MPFSPKEEGLKTQAAAQPAAAAQLCPLPRKLAPTFVGGSAVMQAIERKAAAIAVAAQRKAAPGPAAAQLKIKKEKRHPRERVTYYDNTRNLPLHSIRDPRPGTTSKLSNTLNEPAKRNLQGYNRESKVYSLLTAVVKAATQAAKVNNSRKIVRPGTQVATFQDIVNTTQTNGLDGSSVLARLNNHPTIYQAHLTNVTFIADDFTSTSLGVKKAASADAVAKAVVSKLTVLPGRLTRTRSALEDNFTELMKQDRAVANTHCGTQFEEHVGEFHILGSNTSQIVFTNYRLNTPSQSRRSDRYAAGSSTIYECKKYDKTSNSKVDLTQAEDYAIIRDNNILGPKNEQVTEVVYVFSNKKAARNHADVNGIHKVDLRLAPYNHKVRYLSKKTNKLELLT